MPIGQLVRRGGMAAIRDYSHTLGHEFADALDDIIIFDAITCNVGRYFGNFGVLVNNETNQIEKPAPLFDHGNFLFSLGGLDLWKNETAFREYVDMLLPVGYDDFLEEVHKMRINS